MRVRVQEHWGVFCIKLALILFIGLMLSPARAEKPGKDQPESCSLKLARAEARNRSSAGKQAASEPANKKSTVERDWRGKTVVLDTNVLLVNPNALYDFPGARIILPMKVLQEIDRKKKPEHPGSRSVAANARKAARLIENLTESAVNKQKIRLRNGATLEIEARNLLRNSDDQLIRDILNPQEPDDQIIATAAHYSAENRDKTYFISQDVSAKNKARGLGVRAEEYRSGVSRTQINDENYSGRIDLVVSDEFYQGLAHGGSLDYQRLTNELRSTDPRLAEDFNLFPNQFVVFWRKQEWSEHQQLVKNREKTNGLDQIVGCFDAGSSQLELLRKASDLPYSVKPRNLEQRMLVHVLFHPRIRMVLSVGKAGTGKTLLTMMAGKEQTDERKQYPDRFKQMILMRSLKTVGNEDIGALPGDADQKISPYMQGYMDNLEFLLSHDRREFRRQERQDEVSGAGEAGKKNKDKAQEKQRHMSLDGQIDQLMASGKIKIQVMGFIRGRSLSSRFLVVDEAQNLDPGNLKTIVTRPAEGTKVVLLGDVGQIDDPFLNVYSNSLADLIRRHEIRWTKAREKGDLLTNKQLHQTAIVRLEQGERSDLAEFMTELYEHLDDEE